MKGRVHAGVSDGPIPLGGVASGGAVDVTISLSFVLTAEQLRTMTPSEIDAFFGGVARTIATARRALEPEPRFLPAEPLSRPDWLVSWAISVPTAVQPGEEPADTADRRSNRA